MELSVGQLARLTGAKAVTTSAVRWIPFFLPTLAVAFSSSTSQLTAILGFGEMAGLATLLIGRQLDGGREKLVMTWSLAVVGIAALVALAGNLAVFAFAYIGLIVAAAGYTVGGHTFISRRVPFARRARTIGLFETAWALALLVGAPIFGVLIHFFGWRGPFVAIAIAATVMAIVIANGIRSGEVLADANTPAVRQRLSPDTWIVVAASAAIAVTGLSTVVIAGTWLDESLGVSSGGIGAVAMVFGAAEFSASFSSAAVADRLGPTRSTRHALVLAIVGLAIMTQAGSSLLVGGAGLLLFFLGFEFAIVTSFSIVSEAMPTARGRALAANNAVGTVARGAGIVLSGILYEAFGIVGPVVLSISAAVLGLGLLSTSMRRETA